MTTTHRPDMKTEANPIPTQHTLKACPFCGKQAALSVTSSQGHHSVLCQVCGAQSGPSGTRDKAREAWNARADYARLAAVNGELVAVLEQIKNGDYDNAHDPKAAAHIARAALARAGGAQ